MIIDFLFLIIPIIIIYIFMQVKHSHHFWDNQPVIRKYEGANGLIGLNGSFDFKIHDPSITINYNYNFDKIHAFIDNEFSDNLHINKSFFKYHTDLSGALNISLLKDNNIIGFIHSHPVNIIIDTSEVMFMYVDFLCISKPYRTNDLALLLICSILNSVKDKKQPFLFKRDAVRLPFLPILKSRYHYDDLRSLENKLNNDDLRTVNQSIDLQDVSGQVVENNSKNDLSMNFTELSIDNFDEHFKIIQNELNRYYFRRNFSLEEMKELLFNKKIIKCYFYKGLYILGKDNKLDWDNQTYNTFDIDYILGNIDDIQNKRLLFQQLLIKNNYQFATIPAVGKNINYIIENNLPGANKYYYYTYNYNCRLIQNHELSFNIN